MLLILHAVQCKMVKLNIKLLLKKNCNWVSMNMATQSEMQLFFFPQKMISRSSSSFKGNAVKRGEAMGPEEFKGLAEEFKGKTTEDVRALSGSRIFSVLDLDPRDMQSEK